MYEMLHMERVGLRTYFVTAKELYVLTKSYFNSK